MKTLFLEVPQISSLYHRDSVLFLSQLKEAIWCAGQYDIIVLLQHGPRIDRGSVGFESEIFLRDPFQEFVRDWREAISKLRSLQTLVIYHAEGDVFGSWFELCMAAQIRVFTDRGSRVGFPQLREGLIPLFDAINFEWKNFEIRGFEFWESGPVRSWREFYVMKNWYQTAIPWRTLYSEMDSKQSLLRVLDSVKNNRQAAESFRAMDAIDSSLGQTILKARWFQRLWESYKSKIRNSEETLPILVDGYYKWGSKMVVFSSPEIPQRVHGQHLLFRIADYHPPLKVVYKALLQGWKVVFLYEHSEKGETYLNILRGEILNLLGTVLGESIWGQSIRWFQLETSNQLIISSFEFRRGGEVYFGDSGLIGRRSNGNRFYTKLGVIEIDDQFQKVVPGLTTLGEKVIATRAKARLGQWASIYVQKIFCQLFLYYESLGLNLAEAEDTLRSRGWGSLIMMRYRHLFLMTFPPTEEELARFEIIMPPLKMPLFMRNLKLLSLHLKIVAGYLARKLYQEGITHTLEDADTLVCSALELPPNIKSAAGLFSNFALKRVAEDFAALPEFLWHNPIADEEKNVF